MAQRLGPPALPALRAAFRAESNRLQRWTLLGACAAAGVDVEGDGWLVECGGSRTRPQEERALALLSLAVGPPRARSEPVLRGLVGTERAGSYTQLAATMAALRFGDELVASPASRGGPLTTESIVVALAGNDAREVVERAKAGLGDARPSLAGLVIRAYGLGRAQPTRDAIDFALGLAVRPELPDAVRVAATLFALRGAPEQTVARVGSEPSLRVVLVSSAAARRALFAAGRLGPVPELLAVPKVRVALAVGYALSAPWDRIRAEQSEWGKEALICDAVSLALAWRCAVETPPSAPPVEAPLRVSDATAWLAAAAELARGVPRALPVDPHAARVVALARAGCLDRALLAREIEAAMWRGEVHPDLVAARAWTDLVRDSLLAGSQYVSGRLQLPLDARPPLPRDIEDSHEKFFRCADALFRFLTERGPVPPPSLRLR